MKIKEFQAVLKKRKVSFALFYNTDFERREHNMIYFSQYSGVGVLVVPVFKKPFLIVPKMEFRKAKEGIVKRVYVLDKEKRFFENVKFFLNKNKIRSKKIAIDKNIFTLNAFKELKRNFTGKKYVDISNECCLLRQTKTKKEIVIIKKACVISDHILAKCFSNFKKFKTESDVRAFLEYETKKRGCDLAFPTIVASGVNAVKPHHETKVSRLKKGFCIIDFGVRYKNYCSDTTRTIFFGKISKKEKEIYNFLLAVQKDLIKNIKTGKNCSAVYNECIKSLKKYAKYFTHGLGHGFGIRIHELPNLTEKSKDKIVSNMVFTIEPGIYLKRFGIRIEDDILIEKNKVKVLTKVPKELKVVIT